MFEFLLALLLALCASSAPRVQAQTHVVEGHVLASDASPIKAFRVRAVGDLPKEGGGRRRVEVEREFKAEDGAFELSGLESGNWRLEFSAEGRAVSVLSRLRLGADAPPALPLKTVLYKEARLSGSVVDARTGVPIEGARVSARMQLDQKMSNPLEALPAVVTAKDGTFTLCGFAPAGWELRVEKEGYLVQAGPRFDPAEGQSVGSFVAKLAVGGIVAGRALQADGSALAGAEVAVISVRGIAGRAVSAPDGSFTIPLVRPGHYRVEVRFLDSAGSVGALALQGEVQVKEGERSEVTLARPAGS